MKKKIIYFIVISLVSLIALPINTSAKTIKEFEKEVEKYTKQLEEKKANLAKNDEEVAAIKKKITSIEKQIKEAEQEVIALQKKIDKSNEEIEEKSKESKAILEYYQISNGENIYLEYAFGATSITDMIYRMSIVEQLTEYNDKIMKELEALVIKNKNQQTELNKKKIELRNLRENLEKEKERINADSQSIRETMPNIEEQIKAAKDQLIHYQELGCGPTEDIQKCEYRIQESQAGGAVPSANGFYRPMKFGYLTQGYYGYGGHLGVDLSSSDKAIELYPIANGQVFYNGVDSYGALVVKIRHKVNGQYIYSTYAHMREVYKTMKVGTNVTAFTPIGKMGSTGWSTGPHLHLEITTCDWNKGGGCTWYQYQRSTINPTRYISIPSRWSVR